MYKHKLIINYIDYIISLYKGYHIFLYTLYYIPLLGTLRQAIASAGSVEDQTVGLQQGLPKCGIHQGFTREIGKSGEIYFKYMAFSENVSFFTKTKLWNFPLTSLLWGIAYFQTRPHSHFNLKNDEKEINIVKLGRFAVASLTIPLYCYMYDT